MFASQPLWSPRAAGVGDFLSRHAHAAWHIMNDVGQATGDMVPWGFVVFSAIVLIAVHLRWPR